jgi:hypothetical protein
MIIHWNQTYSNVTEINDVRMLNALLSAVDQVLCHSQIIIFKEHHMICTALQNSLKLKYLK